jgi:hypothetical protein
MAPPPDWWFLGSLITACVLVLGLIIRNERRNRRRNHNPDESLEKAIKEIAAVKIRNYNYNQKLGSILLRRAVKLRLFIEKNYPGFTVTTAQHISDENCTMHLVVSIDGKFHQHHIHERINEDDEEALAGFLTKNRATD